MLKIRLAWLWWLRVRHALPWLRVIWLVDLTCERHEREFCTRSFKITELEKGRWSWVSNCGEAFHTDSWLAEANPGHSDRDAILKALLPGPSTVVLFGPGKARMIRLLQVRCSSCCMALPIAQGYCLTHILRFILLTCQVSRQMPSPYDNRESQHI